MSGKRRKTSTEVLDRPPITPTPFGRLHTRREQRRQRRLRRRRQMTFGGGATVVLALIVVGIAAFFGTKAVTSHGGAKPRTQSTLLIQIRGSDGTAAGSALLAHDTNPKPNVPPGVMLLIPSRVITAVPGHGTQQFGTVLALPNGEQLSRDALSDLADVTVDDSWILDTDALATLVDHVGGISADVPTAVPGPVVVPAGHQQLNGSQAATLATYAPATNPLLELANLQQVLDGVLTKLPRSAGAVGVLLRGLPGGSTYTGSAMTVAALLANYGMDERARNAPDEEGLPTLPIDTGGPIIYRADDARLAQFVRTDLSGVIPPGGLATGNRVYVYNGVCQPGLVDKARQQLLSAGFRFAGSGNAPNGCDNATSRVLIFSTDPPSLKAGATVAKALGLPVSEVHKDNQSQTVADVFVILGRDYLHPGGGK